MNYETFLSETEYSICLLCIFTGVDYIPWAALDTINLFLSGDVCYIRILRNNDIHFNLKANFVMCSEYMQSYIMHDLS